LDLAEISVERDMLVISNEVYEEINCDDARHCCMAAFPELLEWTLIISFFSKVFAVAGLRVGDVYGLSKLA
jgi:aminotransferase